MRSIFGKPPSPSKSTKRAAKPSKRKLKHAAHQFIQDEAEEASSSGEESPNEYDLADSFIDNESHTQETQSETSSSGSDSDSQEENEDITSETGSSSSNDSDSDHTTTRKTAKQTRTRISKPLSSSSSSNSSDDSDNNEEEQTNNGPSTAQEINPQPSGDNQQPNSTPVEDLPNDTDKPTDKDNEADKFNADEKARIKVSNYHIYNALCEEVAIVANHDNFENLLTIVMPTLKNPQHLGDTITLHFSFQTSKITSTFNILIETRHPTQPHTHLIRTQHYKACCSLSTAHIKFLQNDTTKQLYFKLHIHITTDEQNPSNYTITPLHPDLEIKPTHISNIYACHWRKHNTYKAHITMPIFQLTPTNPNDLLFWRFIPNNGHSTILMPKNIEGPHTTQCSIKLLGSHDQHLVLKNTTLGHIMITNCSKLTNLFFIPQ